MERMYMINFGRTQCLGWTFNLSIRRKRKLEASILSCDCSNGDELFRWRIWGYIRIRKPETFPPCVLFVSSSGHYLFLTAWSRVLQEKPIIFQLVKKLPAFYGNLKFIILFNSIPPLDPFLKRLNQDHALTSYLRSILILPSHLHIGLPCGPPPPL